MLDPDFECPNGCDANGFLFDEERRQASACGCREERLRRRLHGDMEASVGRYAPPRFQDLDWSRLPLSGIAEQHGAAATVVRRYATAIERNIRSGRGLWLLGNKGT